LVRRARLPFLFRSGLFPLIGKLSQLLLTPPFEILDGALVMLRLRSCVERPKVARRAGLGIFAPRVETVLAGFQFPDHACAHFEPRIAHA
jgi:hypothetical protein